MTKVIRLFFYGLFFIDTQRAELGYKLEYSHIIHSKDAEGTGMMSRFMINLSFHR